MWPRVLLAIAASACGRISFDAIDAIDATATDAAPCTLGPWSASTRVEELVIPSSASLGAQVSPDGLAIYFGSANANTQELDIYEATRASREEGFGPPARLVALASATYDHNPTIGNDGLELWFSSDRTGARCIYRSVRASRAEAWPAPTVVPELCNARGDYDGAFLSADLRTLVYTLDPVPGTFLATRTSTTDSFPAGRRLDEIVFPLGWGFAALSSDQKTIYFEVYDNPEEVWLWEATRASVDEPFGPASRLPLDREGEDVSITADGRELYFAAGATRAIFMATRECE